MKAADVRKELKDMADPNKAVIFIGSSKQGQASTERVILS
jgi:hypothetical protein